MNQKNIKMNVTRRSMDGDDAAAVDERLAEVDAVLKKLSGLE